MELPVSSFAPLSLSLFFFSGQKWLIGKRAGRWQSCGPSFPQEGRLDPDNVQEPSYL